MSATPQRIKAGEDSVYVSATKAVAAAGTAEPLATLAVNTSAEELFVQPDPANTGNIYLGGPNVDATNGIVLSNTSPGIYITPMLLNKLYIDADNNGDSVRLLYWK